MLRIVRQLK